MFELPFPVIRPVPISTKNKKFFGRVKAWLFTSRHWVFVLDYKLYVPFLKTTLFIPKGFETDFASVPRIFWPVLSPLGILLIPSIFHDFGYRHNYLLNSLKQRVFVNRGRKFFDSLFLRLSYYVNGVKTPDATAWCLLRLFGWVSWKKHRKKEK